MGLLSSAVDWVVKTVFKGNPIVGLVISVALAWLMRPKVPEMPDFGTNDFDNYEKGILLNKQSNDANIPVIYGERMIGGTRVFMETSGTDNEFLYMAIILSEGEINDITEIRIDEKVDFKKLKPAFPYKFTNSSYWMFTIRCKKRDLLIEYLKSKKIATTVYIKPLPLHPLYKKYKSKIPVSLKIWKELVTVPTYPNMTNSQFKYVVQSLKEFDQRY